MKLSSLLAAAGLLSIAIAACVGDEANPTPGNGDPGDPDANTPDSGSNDASGPGDTCTPSCKTADILLDCAGQEHACTLGCSAETKACRSFDPVGPVAASDLAEHPGESDIDLPTAPEPTIIDTTNGAMTHISGPVRAANADANARETIAGITFERRAGVAIFRARNWTLRNVVVQGDIPVAFVATAELKVLGHVSTACGQVGGAAGAAAGNGGNGQSDPTLGTSGGGGGGHGTAGGAGADAIGDDDAPLVGGPPGPVFTFDTASLRGGGLGGSGGAGGGAGGGVILIVGGAGVKIGDGLSVIYKPPTSFSDTVRKGIHVGGCGGKGGRTVGNPRQQGGSGGGAGGLIVVEAPTVLIDANAGLAANGGGGGGTDNAGADARLDDAPARAGVYYNGGCTNGASGGAGAAGASAAEAGKPNTPSCGEYTYGGGGGGGGGRILIHNTAGNVDNRAPSSILSPAASLEIQPLTIN